MYQSESCYKCAVCGFQGFRRNPFAATMRYLCPKCPGSKPLSVDASFNPNDQVARERIDKAG